MKIEPGKCYAERVPGSRQRIYIFANFLVEDNSMAVIKVFENSIISQFSPVNLNVELVSNEEFIRHYDASVCALNSQVSTLRPNNNGK